MLNVQRRLNQSLMWSSAVNLSLLFALAGGSSQQLDASEQAALRRIDPAIIRLLNAGTVTGVGVLIDSQGDFLAHKNAVGGSIIFGRLSSGEMIQLSVASVDEVTQLVMLRAEGWRPINRTPVSVLANESPMVQNASAANSTRLVIILSDRPIRAEMSAGSIVGVIAPSRRGMTLSEIRFEAPNASVGGGLVFSLDGKLAGVLGATLESQANQNSSQRAGLAGGGGVGGGLADSSVFAAKTVTRNSNFGPNFMTVGYSVSPDIIARVVDGFRSPTHQVNHPALGLMCRDAPAGEGALIDSIVPNSPAQAAGLKAGDIVTEINGTPIANQLEYTRVLLKQRQGDTVSVKIRRGAETLTFSVRVGK